MLSCLNNKLTKSYLILLLCLITQTGISQQYYDFYYTNIPSDSLDSYSEAFFGAYFWVSGKSYTLPDECINCFNYKKNSTLGLSTLDSLSNLYSKIEERNIHAQQYVPNFFYFGTDKTTRKPYMIKTLYRIKGNDLDILYQIKVDYYKRPGHKLPGIARIELSGSDKAQKMDTQIVLKSFQQVLRNDQQETPPPIEKL